MLVIIILIILLFVIFNFLYFILPSLSPIPFFPTNKKDIPLIVDILLVESPNLDTVIDLGAGVGTVIFAAAKATCRRSGSNDGWRQTAGLQQRSDSQSRKTGWRLWNVWGQSSIGRRASRASNTTFVAVEINPILCAIMHLRRLFHPNRDNIIILRADMFSLDHVKILKHLNMRTDKQLSNITIYIYVGLDFMNRLKKNFFTMPKGSRIVSYMYEIPGWKSKLISQKTGHNKIFVYRL